MAQIIDALRIQLSKLERPNTHTTEVLPFGVSQIDDHLPNGGLPMGALHEVSGAGLGMAHSAAATLFAAGILARTNGHVIWCLKHRDLFAPALALVGLSVDRVIFVDSGDEKNVLACFEEALRHGGAAGVVGELTKLSMENSRRLQLAAETSGSVGIAIRRFWKSDDAKLLNQPTASQTRWQISSLPSASLPVSGVGRSRWRVELLRCRGKEAASFEVEGCDAKGNISISANMGNRSNAAPNGGQCATA